MKDGKPEVFNVRDSNTPPDAIYVGRSPGKYPQYASCVELSNKRNLGNGHDTCVPIEEREANIRHFEIVTRIKLMSYPDYLDGIRGRDLVCHCKPLPCHADILLKYANRDKGIPINDILLGSPMRVT